MLGDVRVRGGGGVAIGSSCGLCRISNLAAMLFVLGREISRGQVIGRVACGRIDQRGCIALCAYTAVCCLSASTKRSGRSQSWFGHFSNLENPWRPSRQLFLMDRTVCYCILTTLLFAGLSMLCIATQVVCVRCNYTLGVGVQASLGSFFGPCRGGHFFRTHSTRAKDAGHTPSPSLSC